MDVCTINMPKASAASPIKKAADKLERRPSRQGRKFVGGHFYPATAKEVKTLAADRTTTVKALLEEAIADLLKKYDKVDDRKKRVDKPEGRPSRQGRRFVGTHVDPATAKEVKTLAADRTTTVQELMEEAIADLLKKYDKANDEIVGSDSP